MKPVRIRLKNAGAFLDESIDFTRLSDIFLVTGKTGSGKTTIFNAMTYALYGKLSGGESKGIHFHSDFSDPAEEGSVDFEFLIGGRRYRVMRTIPGTQLTRNNTKRHIDVKVAFDIFDARQGIWVPQEGKASELTEKIEALIGLSADEFTQIVLLPQGKFAEFLGKRPKERKETLSKLFPVDTYRRISERAAEEAKAATAEITAKQSALSEELADFDGSSADGKLASLTKEETALHGRIEALVAETAALGKEESRLSSAIQKEERRQSLLREKDELDARKESVGKERLCLERSRNALSVREKIAAHEKAQDTLRQKRAELSGVSEAHEAAVLKAERLEKERSAREEESRSLERARLTLHETEKRRDRAKEAAALRAEHAEACRAIEELYRKTAASLLKAEAERSRTAEEIEKTDRLIQSNDIRRKELEDSKAAQEAAYTAGTIAKALTDGEPCPVCGAVHHPSPAALPKSRVDFERQLELCGQAAQNLERSRKTLSEQEQDLAQKHAVILRFTEQLEQSAQSLSVALPSRSDIPVRERPLPTGNSYSSQQQSITDAVNRASQAQAKLSQLEADGGKSAEELEEELSRIRQEISRAETSLAAYDESVREAETQKAAAASTKEALTRQCGELELAAEEARLNADRALEASPFADTAELAQALADCPPTQIAAREKKVADFDRAYSSVTAKLEELPPSGQDVQSLEEALVAVRKEAEGKGTERTELQDRLTQVVSERTTLSHKIETVARLEAELSELQRRHAPLIRLSADINGQKPNPKGISLESWVLGTYFEEVVLAANRYFTRFSSGRYAFVLETDRQGGGGERGLDLSISDSFTGLSRASDSLSGGEKFMASLCLALALTDVVQQKSGGIRLDSLFIDEGFGALDAQLLDIAVSILEDVREERMVGIISHVESLSSEIPCHIEVEKSSRGSTITLSGCD